MKEPAGVILDLDQLRTFLAIAETGSFTRAAEEVHRTQSAVSMQMRRLEERVGRAMFVREGRASRLTGDGEKLLDFARRMMRLNDEAVAAFSADDLSGAVRLGTPADYAARFLPEVLARFARSNPHVEVSVSCEPSVTLSRLARSGRIDLAIVTMHADTAPAENIRREPLMWVTSAGHVPEPGDAVPLALDRPPCIWRAAALEALAAAGRPYRILYTSMNPSAISATVLSGLAISVLAESAVQPGMRVLTEREGFPPLPMCDIGLVRSPEQRSSPVVDALATHIVASLANLGGPAMARAG